MTTLLTTEQYESTLLEPMTDITGIAGDKIDIWPYANELAKQGLLSATIIENQTIEIVYKNGPDTFHHVLLPTGHANTFIVVIIDNVLQAIMGHYALNLNEVYGVE